MLVKSIYVLTTVLVYCGKLVSCDEYLDQSQGQCDVNKDVISCTKYRVLRFISNYTESSFFEKSLGPVTLLKYENVDDTQSMFPGEARYLTDDSEIGKFFKFVKRQIDHFLNHQSIAISLPEGARFITLDSDMKGIVDGRGKKKKADLLLSLLTLFKVFKIKVLVALALAGIIVIKKVLLISAFILPSIIHNLKVSCMKAAQAAGGAYHHHSIETDHEDLSGGFSSYGASGWNGGKTGYNTFGDNPSGSSYLRRQRK